MSLLLACLVALSPFAFAVAPDAPTHRTLRADITSERDGGHSAHEASSELLGAEHDAHRFSSTAGEGQGTASKGYSRTILGKDVMRNAGRVLPDGTIYAGTDAEMWAAYGPYDTNDAQRGVHMLCTFVISVDPTTSGGNGIYVDVVNWGRDSPNWWTSAIVLWETEVPRAAFPADGTPLQIHGIFMVPVVGKVKTEFRVRTRWGMRGLTIHRIIVREFPLDITAATLIQGLAPGYKVIPAGSHVFDHGTGSAYQCDIAGGNEDFYASPEGMSAPGLPYMPCWKADRRTDRAHAHMTFGPYLRTPKGVPQLVTFTLEVLDGESNEVIEVDVWDAHANQRLGMRRIVYEHFGRKPGKLVVPLIVTAYTDNLNSAEYRVFWRGGVTLVHHKVVVGVVPDPVPGMPAGGPPPKLHK